MNVEYGIITVEVPDWAHWLAWDDSGECWAYLNEPRVNHKHSCWSPTDRCSLCGAVDPTFICDTLGKLPLPEPGDWREQLYYIGEFEEEVK